MRKSVLNQLILLTAVLVWLAASNTSVAFTGTTPPDSTTTLVNKTAAIYLVEEGKTFYNENKIKEALIKFRQATVKDPNSWKAAYWVGKCHYRLNNYGYSLKYANQAMILGQDKVTDEIYFLLGNAHHRLGNIDTALVNYELALSKMSPNRAKVLRVDKHIAECEFAKKELAKEPVVTRTRLLGNINSGYHDYGVVMLDANTIYFTSRRSGNQGGGMNPDDQQYFSDTYRASYNKERNRWENISNDLGKINSDGFDALNHMSSDGNFGIITLNNTATDVKKTTRGSDICEIKMNNKGTWNTPRAIKNKTINTSYFEGSATITADGNTMYFATDRRGEKSSQDIYMVEKVGKKWGEAQPLPMNVNTIGYETTPFITPDGKYLFFSSDGHVGLGGRDIYVTENLGDSWSDPINLGAGINTVTDDTHFVYSKEFQRAFISGFEIIGQKASIDIYELDITNFTIPTAK